MMETFSGKLVIQQRVLPAYRAPFFDALAKRCEGGLVVYAGRPRSDESIDLARELHHTRWQVANNIHISKVGHPAYFLLQPGFTAWIMKENPDGLIVEANPRYLCTPKAVRWMHAVSRPVLGWGLAAPPAKGWIGKIILQGRNRFISRLDGLIAYSRQDAAEYASSGFPQNKIFVAPNSAAFRPTADAPIRPVLKDRQARVLFVGRLQERKRIDLLLQSCAELPESIRPQLVVVGDGPVRSDLEALAGKIYPQTVFTGALSGKKLEEQFLLADLFVLPGTGGLAVQQALAYALPVIVGQADGSQGQLVCERNGWLVQPDDKNCLRSTLTEALSDMVRLRNMGEESFRIARDEVNIEIMVDAFIHALNSLRGP